MLHDMPNAYGERTADKQSADEYQLIFFGETIFDGVVDEPW